MPSPKGYCENGFLLEDQVFLVEQVFHSAGEYTAFEPASLQNNVIA
jgi:hypothetical protein